MNRPKYCCQKGSVSPMLAATMKRAVYKPGSWIEIPYTYKKRDYLKRPSNNIKRLVAYYNKRHTKFRFVGNQAKGKIIIKYVGNK